MCTDIIVILFIFSFSFIFLPSIEMKTNNNSNCIFVGTFKCKNWYNQIHSY